MFGIRRRARRRDKHPFVDLDRVACRSDWTSFDERVKATHYLRIQPMSCVVRTPAADLRITAARAGLALSIVASVLAFVLRAVAR